MGTATNGGGVASAILSLNKAVPAFITKKHYIKLQEWLNNGKEYEYLRKEYEDLRYTFNNQKLFHILHKHFKDIRTYHTSTLYHLRSLYSILYYFYTFLCL